LVEVAAGIIRQNGRFLITRRRMGDHLGGLWEFPGGKLEAGETLVGCLHRELREELGIEVTAPSLYRTIRHSYPEKTVELHFFRCELKAGEPQKLDCEDFRWATITELRSYEFPPADRPLIEALEQEAAEIAD
jgi:8-oxo-dGTP diphosphatase